MKIRVLFLALLLALAVSAADTERTAAGNLVITPMNHATVLFQFGGKNIYVDPWSQANYSSAPRADYIFITDIHGDHMDAKAIDQIRKEGTVIIAPAAVAKTITTATVINNGEKKKFGDIDVEAVPMYNLQRGPQPGALYHTKGRGNGYVFTFGGKRVYIAGDTEGISEMKDLKNIDIAFMCMNLPYTMTPEEAAAAVKSFRPKVVYPYHYRGSDPNAFAAALKDEKGIEVRLRNWY